MTKAQRKEHKIGNQQRKSIILEAAKKSNYHQSDAYLAQTYARYGVCQNGKYTSKG